MNGTYGKTIEAGVIAFPDWKAKIAGTKRRAGTAMFALAGLFALFLLVLLKSKTAIDLYTEPLFFVYSIFVTTFVLSRLVSAFFFQKNPGRRSGKKRFGENVGI